VRLSRLEQKKVDVAFKKIYLSFRSNQPQPTTLSRTQRQREGDITHCLFEGDSSIVYRIVAARTRFGVGFKKRVIQFYSSIHVEFTRWISSNRYSTHHPTSPSFSIRQTTSIPAQISIYSSSFSIITVQQLTSAVDNPYIFIDTIYHTLYN
jgi:hypothetical protein